MHTFAADAPPRLRWLIAFSILALFGAVLAVPSTAEASTQTVEHERDFTERLNAERTDRGGDRLRVASDLTEVARRHSAKMASESRLHHNPSLGSQVSGWSRVGENVGRGGSVSSVHTALMNSTGHRDNILDGNFSEIGIGVVVSGSTIWVTQVFRLPTGGLSAASSFNDVGSSSHADNIYRLYDAGVTSGCTTRSYCPTDQVTRAQMASFLARAKNLPEGATSGIFSDVNGGAHAGNIAALAHDRITSGCTSTRFCPTDTVTRAQMATFLANALDLDTSGSASFRDVKPSGTHAGAIAAIAAEEITLGCDDGRYCPTDRVTRAEMASFLVRAFEL